MPERLCAHERLDEDGYCRACGVDMRSGKDLTPPERLCAEPGCRLPENHSKHDVESFFASKRKAHPFRPADRAPSQSLCELCDEPMPKGEEMFKYHGYSGPCSKSITDSKATLQTLPRCPKCKSADVAYLKSHWFCYQCAEQFLEAV